MTPFWLYKCKDCGWYEELSAINGMCHYQRLRTAYCSNCPDWCLRKKNGIQYTDAHKKAKEE